MQIISTDKNVRNDTIQDLKEFNSQNLTTQAKKGEQLVSMMPAIKKAFNLLGDDIIELSTEIETLNNKIVSYDEEWLEASKAKMLKQIDDEKRADLILFRMKKLFGKTLNKWPKLVIIIYGNQNSMVSFLKELNYKI